MLIALLLTYVPLGVCLLHQELSEVRHAHVKLKKSLQDRCAELDHAQSRAEQYETEVKKLRSRIEELKNDLSSVEDEVQTSIVLYSRLHKTNKGDTVVILCYQFINM